MSDPVYHEVKWTAESVQRFWNFYGNNEAGEDSYFSKKFAARIVGMARRHARLEGPVVDLGCGPGFLSDELLRQGLPVRALDSSSRSIDRVRARLAGRTGFLGASVGELDALPLEDGKAGAVFMIEVLEHLPAEVRAAVAAEAARVLRPGGVFVATTPNEEDLDAKKIACPECGCVFHRVQHMHSLDATALRELFEASGFETVFASGVNFRHFPDRAAGRLVRLATRTLPGLGGAAVPHLIAIGRRRGR